ncbi:MAG: hypothetical protein GC192_14775 [Bacteroidetes bacterium]|nr:hypothetical protein [Bacteroidota bacterium]
MNEPTTLTEHFRKFLAERPAISPDRLADELGFDRANLQKIIQGSRSIPQPRRGDFSRIMRKYGYLDVPRPAWQERLV